jgi:capsular exopolysaccharide synthesis family protein
MSKESPLARYVVPLRRWWPIVAGTVALGLVVAWVTLPDRPESAEQVETDPSVSYRATLLLQRDYVTPETANLDLVVLLAQQGEIEAAVEAELGDRVSSDSVGAVQLVQDKDLGTVELAATEPTEAQVTELLESYASNFIAYFDALAVASAVAEYEAKLEQVAVFTERIESLQDQAEALPEGSVDRRLLEAEIDVLIQQYGVLQGEAQTLNLQTFAGDPTFRTLQAPVPTPVAAGGMPLSMEVPDTPWGRLALAFVVAVVLGAVVVLAVDWLDTRLRTREDVEDAFGLPVIAEVPRQTSALLRWPSLADLKPSLGLTALRQSLRPRSSLAHLEPSSGLAEVYRSLRLSLMLAPRWQLDRGSPTSNGSIGSAVPVSGAGQPRTVVVTSARDGEGKSTVVANLAASFAESGQRVLIVDCDFHRSTVGDLLEAPDGAGLGERVSSELIGLADLALETSVPNVAVVRSGPTGSAPAWFLAESKRVVEEAVELADLVLFDTGPLLATNEAGSLIPNVDVTLLVTRSGRLPRGPARLATEQLTRLHATVAGVVLVGSEVSRRYGYYFEPIRRSSAATAPNEASKSSRTRHP